ncbi:helix-turn-helix domain-containing protein [Mycolicibacterium litorale]|uniref:helix-turn-helix domain-containing protein n=1 Tax=Mycolicibacterium litorale TaxID=758802 RepID=UPI003CF28DE2
MGYRELPPPPRLRALVECGWERTGPDGPARILPDGCMDLIRMDGRIVVAGPDSAAYLSAATDEPIAGLRFRPGVLPRLLGVPANRLRNTRIPLGEVCDPVRGRSLAVIAEALAAQAPRTETAPWSLPALARVTARLGSGAAVQTVADELGWSPRTLQRQCGAIYGYGPATLRRILRFRRAMRLVGEGLPAAEVAARVGYADQPHLHREVRDLAGVPLGQLGSGANRSTQLPSGSATVA